MGFFRGSAAARRLRLLLACAPGLLAACATTSSGPMTGTAPLTRVSVSYAPFHGDRRTATGDLDIGPPRAPELDASVRFTLPSLLAAHGTHVVAAAPDVPALRIEVAEVQKTCQHMPRVCNDSGRLVLQLSGTDGQPLWTHDSWVYDESYDSRGQKEVFRQLVADMARDKVIPAGAQVPERSFAVLTGVPEAEVDVRSYEVRIRKTGEGENFKLTSDRSVRESLRVKVAWHGADLLPQGIKKAGAASHAVVKSLGPAPAGLRPGCDDAAHDNPQQANAEVVALLKHLAAESQAGYGLYLAPLPAVAGDESPLDSTGLFIASSVDESGLMTFANAPRGASRREAGVTTPYCAVFYDTSTDTATVKTWRPVRPVDMPATYYDRLDGIGYSYVQSLAGEFDANLTDSLDKNLPLFIEEMTP